MRVVGKSVKEVAIQQTTHHHRYADGKGEMPKELR